ncbi:hypothetical protein EZV73_12610 [Acidaminobacter sp. JC074]|uniref:TRM11 family SAM-dependent methyltransferase n=1 Tax=Acidaminobacter sp. JC074 TaxID=2530199 RepID=UPI001F10C814|nr:hypothetical protein [Acidaminobacter sp. JC074]MCH4888425.1 hypothetical protein [Acidaminobacter sp. JC074]
MKHAILLKPNANIPYFEEMKKMCIYEASIVLKAIGVDYSDIKVEEIGPAHYMFIETEEAIDQDLFGHIENLSFYYTYFKVVDESFMPVKKVPERYFGEDLSNRLKYNGKTNEMFTRMMLNLAIYTSKYYAKEVINVFDPVCGRGTTLFEAMIRGHHAYGAELDKRSVSELGQYFQRYLKEGKYKHQVVRGKAIQNKLVLGETFEAYIGTSKEEVKKKTGKTIKVLRGDTTQSNLYFKKQSMDVLVGDLPYGVQHMSKHDEGHSRSVDELLDASFKAWYQLVKKGGALALSWNTYTNTRDELKEKLEQAGFTVIDDEIYLGFHHRVSQAINRDVIVAIK